MSLHVWDENAEREARPVLGPAGARLLALLGAGAGSSTVGDDSHLGDELDAAREALGLGDCAALVAGTVRGEADRRGLVESYGDLPALAEVARLGDRVIVVSDLPHASSGRTVAEALRATLDDTRRRVVGVLSLGEALDCLYEIHGRALAGTLVPGAHRENAREGLFSRTLMESRLELDWGMVAAAAVGLARHLDEKDEQAHFELALVRDIARRHDGISAPIVWPEPQQLEVYPLERRLAVVAHVVQSVADGELGAVPAYAARARVEVADAARTGPSVQGIKVLGAVGRALAAVGSYEDATEVLTEAFDGFLAVSPKEVSYVLSELIRLEGMRGNLERVEVLWRRTEPLSLDSSSLQYVRLAIGRAFAQGGKAKEAIDVLSECGPPAPRHVQASALRWRVHASRLANDARARRESIEELQGFEDSAQPILARLDDAGDLTPKEVRDLLDSLLSLVGDGDEARRTLSRLAPGLSTRAISERREVVRRLCAEFRY